MHSIQIAGQASLFVTTNGANAHAINLICVKITFPPDEGNKPREFLFLKIKYFFYRPQKNQ